MAKCVLENPSFMVLLGSSGTFLGWTRFWAKLVSETFQSRSESVLGCPPSMADPRKNIHYDSDMSPVNELQFLPPTIKGTECNLAAMYVRLGYIGLPVGLGLAIVPKVLHMYIIITLLILSSINFYYCHSFSVIFLAMYHSPKFLCKIPLFLYILSVKKLCYS